MQIPLRKKNMQIGNSYCKLDTMESVLIENYVKLLHNFYGDYI